MLPISVIIPCYNAEKTLARTLASCVVQPEAAQIVVVDDGSRDASAEVVAHYARQHPRVELLRMPDNGGAARARNWGAMHALHPLLGFIDADDEYMPGALASAAAFMAEHPHQPSIRLDVEFCGFPANITGHPQFESYAAVLSNTVPSSLVIRRSVYAAFGGFPLDDVFRRHGGEDGAFSLALLNIFGNPRLDDCKRVRMHYHPNIHAERYFRISMGMLAAPDELIAATRDASWRFVHRAYAAVKELRDADLAPQLTPPPTDAAPAGQSA
ncbi:Glycosyl transferase family protein [Paraburkholderia piptadeniae]|uniref:Glycosyl transferase family protein n=1 Tax=Paraburkholderia piptadeniae TaxID=1701573 RepID=A0A1N7SAX7_9BURK|nr:glycosyltransferase family 2 protein [Paraburkholderia piptadeniae]SIT44559.1 Glycosyl transferase family protein [Paraburkholderia piptadeniae]